LVRAQPATRIALLFPAAGGIAAAQLGLPGRDRGLVGEDVTMRKSTGLRTTAVALVALCGLSPALARAAAPAGQTPTLAARTGVHGTDLPTALVSGSWKAAGKGWHLAARSVAPPLGRTNLLTTWRGPNVHVDNGTVFFKSGLSVTHQSQTAFSITSEQRLRVCGPKKCSKWFVLKTGIVPLTYSVHGKPFEIRVTSGRGIAVATMWVGPPTTVHAEWQYYQVQKGPDYATTDLTVAAS
jgi:hypothetical protein